MAWFRRNKTQVNTIPELQEYYNAEKRERSGLSWLLALVSVACAGLLLIGLIFGGKWLYRKLAHNMDKNKTTTAQNQTKNQSSSQPAAPSATDTTPSDTSSSSVAQTTPAASTQTSTTPATSATPPSTSTTPSTSGTSSTASSATTPAASGATATSSPLPHTGPANIIATFFITVVAATATHYAIFKRKFLK